MSTTARVVLMRLHPAQVAVFLICGEELPMQPGQSLKDRIKEGHALLVQLSGVDFGYDLLAWHTYLKLSRDGGYTWGRNIVLPRVMKDALASPEWCDVVQEIQQSTLPGHFAKARRSRKGIS